MMGCSQLNHGSAPAIAAGTGIDHSRPMTLKKMIGTQIQWIVSLVSS
jgi:hypothetical protein